MGRYSVVSNLIWRFLERSGAQLVSFVVSIILARILLPEEYGIVAIATVVITIMNVFVDNGLGNALIQKKECDDTDYSTALWANVIVCTILYAIAYIIVAPIMAYAYADTVLKWIIRIMGLSIIVSSVKNIQQAYVSRTLQFKKFFISTSTGTIISAIVGVYMAYSGCGVWALVAQYLTNTIIDTVVLGFVIEWRPRLIFSMERLRGLISYGYKLLASALINCIYDNFRQLIVGKVHSSKDLAFYNRGKQFPSIIMVNINSSIDSVLFPVMSREQDSPERLRNMAHRSMTVSAYILFPFLFGLAAVADHMIPLLLTEKWNDSIVFIQIFCLFYTFHPIQTTNLNVIKAVGRSDLFLRLEIIQTVVGIILLIPVIKLGPVFIALMYLVAAVFNALIIGAISGQQMGYSVGNQVKDMLPYYCMSSIMALTIRGIGLLSDNHMIMIGQVVIGILIYVFLSVLFKPSSYRYIFYEIVKYKKDMNND